MAGPGWGPGAPSGSPTCVGGRDPRSWGIICCLPTCGSRASEEEQPRHTQSSMPKWAAGVTSGSSTDSAKCHSPPHPWFYPEGRCTPSLTQGSPQKLIHMKSPIGFPQFRRGKQQTLDFSCLQPLILGPTEPAPCLFVSSCHHCSTGTHHTPCTLLARHLCSINPLCQKRFSHSGLCQLQDRSLLDLPPPEAGLLVIPCALSLTASFAWPFAAIRHFLTHLLMCLLPAPWGRPSRFCLLQEPPAQGRTHGTCSRKLSETA